MSGTDGARLTLQRTLVGNNQGNGVQAVRVADLAIEDSIVLYLRHTRTLVEHAGASTLAAAQQIKSDLRGKRVVLIASGANVTAEQLAGILTRS